MAGTFGQHLVKIRIGEFVSYTGQPRRQSAFVPHLGNRRGKQVEFVRLWSTPRVALVASDAVEFRKRVLGMILVRKLFGWVYPQSNDDRFFLQRGQTLIGKPCGDFIRQTACAGIEHIDRWCLRELRLGFVGFLHRMALNASQRLE